MKIEVIINFYIVLLSTSPVMK